MLLQTVPSGFLKLSLTDSSCFLMFGRPKSFQLLSTLRFQTYSHEFNFRILIEQHQTSRIFQCLCYNKYNYTPTHIRAYPRDPDSKLKIRLHWVLLCFWFPTVSLYPSQCPCPGSPPTTFT